mgnify:CR=1 FL=1
MVPFQTDIWVDTEIPIFQYLIFVKFYTDILKYFQTDTKYLVFVDQS